MAKYAQANNELTKTDIWTGRLPRKLFEIRAYPLVVCNAFPSRNRSLLYICEMSEYTNCRHTFKPLKNNNVAPTQEHGDDETSHDSQFVYGRYTATCIKARCVVSSCPFRVNIHRDTHRTWIVESLTSRECAVPTLNNRLDYTAYQAPMLADIVVQRIISGLSLTRKDILHALSLAYKRHHPIPLLYVLES